MSLKVIQEALLLPRLPLLSFFGFWEGGRLGYVITALCLRDCVSVCACLFYTFWRIFLRSCGSHACGHFWRSGQRKCLILRATFERHDPIALLILFHEHVYVYRSTGGTYEVCTVYTVLVPAYYTKSVCSTVFEYTAQYLYWTQYSTVLSTSIYCTGYPNMYSNIRIILYCTVATVLYCR